MRAPSLARRVQCSDIVHRLRLRLRIDPRACPPPFRTRRAPLPDRLTTKLPTTRRACLAAVASVANFGAAAGTVEMWGGPLAGTLTYAVALLNRGARDANVSGTWGLLGAGLADATFCVRDLWRGVDLGPFARGISMAVGAEDVAMLRLSAPPCN